jgi:sugar/nucleoside kinase (ribokinase family)
VNDLLVVGDCNPDLLVAGRDVVPEFAQREKLVEEARLGIGGSATIMACGAARLGLATALVACLGDDLFGRYMLDALAERNVDSSGCVIDAGVSTGLTIALIQDGDRAILTSPGAIAALSAEQIDRDLLRDARHLHIASYFLLERLHPGLPGLIGEAREAGLSVSLDPQEDPAGDWDRGLRQLMPMLDVLFVNEAEAASLDTGTCRLVVVKRGARGASAAGIDVAPPAVVAVDATGAGDSFDAGFLAAWLAGESVKDALRLGCACGALSTRGLGGTTAQPTLDEARAALV